ncbi:hypothetical protein T484DRAFT_1647366, partial [Baffinella frigidus]
PTPPPIANSITSTPSPHSFAIPPTPPPPSSHLRPPQPPTHKLNTPTIKNCPHGVSGVFNRPKITPRIVMVCPAPPFQRPQFPPVNTPSITATKTEPPASSPALPPPPSMTESAPQSNTPPASTHRNLTPHHPAKRTRYSEQDNPLPPPPALLPSKRSAPPHADQFCPPCYAIGCHWVETCPETNQQLKPSDFERLLQIARRATKRSHPDKKERANKKNATPPAVPMEIDPLPSTPSVTTPMTEGVAPTIPTAPIAP